MSNTRIITEKDRWKSTLSLHKITDVYFQYEYVKSMSDHLNAKPILIDYSRGNGGFLYSLLVQDIANDPRFAELIPQNVFFDAETPYGYGGPCFYGDMRIDEKTIDECRGEIKSVLAEQGIVSQFIRFYPLMFREEFSTMIVDRFGTYKKTIYMDLKDEETIISNLDSQYRRKIRKAKEAGVTIECDKGEMISDFIRLYDMTMSMHDAEDMYYFGENYYKSLMTDFRDNFVVFYARLDGRIVGSSIFLYDDNYMHYHLGGRDIEAPSVPFENLLMVEAAKWGSNHKKEKLHIGGGLSDGDSLFQYKKKFNRNGMLPFYIGRTIVDKEKYTKLLTLRTENDKSFDPENRFYIQYRF